MKAEDYEVDMMPLGEANGGGYTAIISELPGCRSDGETAREALDNAYDAIRCWIEAKDDLGRTVLPPRRLAA